MGYLDGDAALRRRHPATAELAARIRPVVERLGADDARREREREHPFAALRELADLGLTRLRVPAEHGGDDVPLAAFFEIVQDFGYADASFPNVLRGHFSFIEILRHVRDERVREHWFGEIVAGRFFGNGQSEPREPGSAPTGTLSTTLTAEHDGGWRLDGTKIYSSGALYADYVRVSSRGPGDELLWAIASADDPATVDRLDDWSGFGQQLSASGTTHYRGARVEPIGVFPIRDGAGQHLAFTQLIHLATLAGILRRVVDEAIGVLQHRSQPGRSVGPVAPADDPVRLGVIGELATAAISAEALVARTAEGLDLANAERTDENALEVYGRAFLAVSAAQIRIIDDALEATGRLFEVGGASLTDRERALDRFWRNARTLASHNPVIDKPAAIGRFLVHGTLPKAIWGGA